MNSFLQVCKVNFQNNKYIVCTTVQQECSSIFSLMSTVQQILV